MNKHLHLLFLFAFLILTPNMSNAQREPVSWDIHTDSVKETSATIVLKANLAAGWHLYSQFMEEGGPMPTSFVFGQGAYEKVGPTIESGKRTTYHDSIYDMEVSWYANTVIFSQGIRINAPTTIKGSIEYMVCNNELCIPGRKSFAVLVALPRK